MAAAYDTYDYPSYWIGREYEHKAEIHALKNLLSQIPKINTILEIGAGFGRLTPSYRFRAKKVILSDPSAKLLGLAKSELKGDHIKFIQSTIENLPDKIRPGSIDLILVVRVLHHIRDLDEAFEIVTKLLDRNGYLLLEFANKQHLKATVSEFFKGNFTFPLDIFPKELKSTKRQKTLPFMNYHPDLIKEKLQKHGFKILDKRSVSNIRSPFIKKVISTPTLIFFESLLQKPLSRISFGPSIFILARKTG